MPPARIPAGKNPLRLNPLQSRTLALLQLLAASADPAQADAGGAVRIPPLPHPHGDHFHIGNATVPSSVASGLHNPSVWRALERKGLVAAGFPDHLELTAAGNAYDTGLLDTATPSDH